MKYLIVIDMQKDFVDGSLGTKEAEAIVDNVVREINGDYDEIIVTKDTHFENYLDSYEGKNLPVVHCVKGTPGWQLDAKVEKAREDKLCVVFEKPTFGSLNLLNYFRSCEPDEITFVGLCTDICVISNALLLRALLPNTVISYVEDATAATTPANKVAALATMNANQIYAKQ